MGGKPLTNRSFSMPENLHLWSILEDVMLILALAGLVIPALQRFKVSPALGYLVFGLIIGPHGLGLMTERYPALSSFVIEDKALIHLLAELGVVFLLFMIGLELTFAKLWQLKRFVLGLGGLQIIVTAAVIVLIVLNLGYALPVSVVLGAALALSSTAIVMQIMMERHMISRPTGQICFSVLLMQDLAVVPILVMVGVLAGQADGGVALVLVKAVATAVVVIAVMFFLGRTLLRPALQLLSFAKNAEWLLAITLFCVIGAAGLTQAAGLSAALGAFLAGLLIGETDFRYEIEVLMEPVKGLLMGIFFLSVGMSIDLAAFQQYPVMLPAAVAGIFLVKAAIFFPLALLFNIPRNQAVKAAVMLAQCGEFAFIVIGLAVTGGLLPQEDAQFFLMLAAISMLCTPLLSRLGPVLQNLLREKYQETDPQYTVPTENTGHIVIVGFGHVGRSLADILERQTIPYIGIDMDGENVKEMKKRGYPVIYGNGRHVKMWKALNVEHAGAIAVTVSAYDDTKAIIKMLRKYHPYIPILARTQEDKQPRFQSGDNTVFIAEQSEATRQIARVLLDYVGLEKDIINSIIATHREGGDTPEEA